MYRIFKRSFNGKCDRVIIIGTDIPTLPVENIRMAFGKLIKHDIVLGPSINGGYYLIGLRKLQKEVFVNINWGTREVFH